LTGKRTLAAGAVALGLLAAGAGPAAADVTGLALGVVPSDLQAGGAPDVTVSTGFAYSSTADDVKDLSVRLPPGLVGNPQVPARCTAAQLTADACPAASKIGTVAVGANVTLAALGIPNTSSGDVYNLEPQGDEPARIGVVVRPSALPPTPPFTLIPTPLSKIVLQAPLHLRPGAGGFALESTFADQPRTVGSALGDLPVQIQSIDLTFAGTVGGQAFMRMPTSCGAATATGRANSYDAPSTFATDLATVTPTGCGGLPFSPSLSGSIAAPRRATDSPAVTTTLHFRDGDAALKSARVTLPKLLGPNAAVLPRACPAGSFAAGTCPATARVGSAGAASPLNAEPLSGPVLLVENPGGLPKVGVELSGAVSLRLLGDTELTANGLATTFPDNPDLPLTSFGLRIDGGPGGLLTAARGLCSPGARATASASLTAHSGATATARADLPVTGCGSGGDGPGSRGRPRGSAGFRIAHGRGTLIAGVRAARGGPRLRKVGLRLARGLRFQRGKRRLARVLEVSGTRLSSRRVKVGRGSLSLRPAKPVARVRVRWRGIRVGAGTLRKLRHRRARLAFPVTVTDAAGHTTRLKLRARPRIRR
jgi:hypothetical protein